MKKIFSVFVLLLLAGACVSYAEPFRNHTFGIGPEIYRVEYIEPELIENKGFMYGGYMFYAYHNDTYQNNWMFKAEGRAAYGEVDYESSGTGSSDNISDYLFEGRLIVGYDFFINETTVYTLYSGFGYRYLNDDSSGTVTTTGNVGYERESNYYYSPIGLEGTIDLENSWTVGAGFEYDLLWAGRQISHLEDASSLYSAQHNSQNRGYGLRGNLKLIRKNEKFDVSIEPFIRYWKIERSEESLIYDLGGGLILVGAEPVNKTTEIGGNVSIQF